MIFGSTVTFQAPAHAVGLGVIDDLHVVDVSVTSDTANAAIHVHRMVKVNVVGRFVNSNPGGRDCRFSKIPERH